MARPKRSAAQREADMVTLAQLYLKGVTLTAIAAQLQVHRTQVSYDLKIIRQRWRDATVLDFNEATNRELERIDLIEAENWEAWQASKAPQETTTTERVQLSAERATDRARVQKRARPGDPRYMDSIRWCVEQRVRILGLAPREGGSPSALAGVQVNIALAPPDDRLLAAEAAFVQALYAGEAEPGPSGAIGPAVGLIEGHAGSSNGGPPPV